METVNKYLSGAIVPFAIVIFAFMFIFLLRGLPLSRPSKMIKILFEKGTKGEGSPIRAVIFALAGTLGVGNIVGVASAIAMGGAGAVFWMWISALLAMILKYCEVVLALLHRRVREDGYYGGAMYYMKDYFNSCHKFATGTVFSYIFVVLCLLNGGTMGCMIQSNSIAASFNEAFNFDEKTIGIALALLSAFVFFCKGKSLFALCEKLVPFVSILYVGMCMIIILSPSGEILKSFNKILNGAFSFESAGAGAFGFLISRALRFGTIRGLFSNEAGCGTSPIAHATSNTDSPCKQGILGIVEVFIDTIIVCSMTAFVVLKNEDIIAKYNSQPMLIVAKSFERELGSGAVIILSVCIFLFAFATIICWGFYGKECVYFVNKSKLSEKIYYSIYIALTFLGAFASMDAVWELADFAVGAMVLMNLYVLWKMKEEIKRETIASFNKKELPKRKL